MSDHDEEAHADDPGPAENADAATKADLGLGGTPAQAYSPEGMDDDAASHDDAGTYQPEDDGGDDGDA